MNRFLAAAGAAAFLAAPALAAPEYVTLKLEKDVAAPAAQVWSKVGKYCDIADWANLPCQITSGDGGLGTVRSLTVPGGGAHITEILVGKTDLSYGYTQPAVDGQFYNLYHGYLEAKPVSDKATKLLYTLVWDVSNLPDQAAKDADMARRRQIFEGALAKMKEIAEK
jgi:hypothetical protein